MRRAHRRDPVSANVGSHVIREQIEDVHGEENSEIGIDDRQ